MRTLYSLVVVLALLQGVGCAKKLTRSSVQSLELGKTTGAQLTAMFGKPDDVRTFSSDTSSSELRLHRHEGYSTIVFVRVLDLRALGLELKNDKLAGFYYYGTQGDNATRLDEKLAAQIVVNKSTADDAIKLLGQPSGKCYANTEFPLFKGKLNPNAKLALIWIGVDGATAVGWQSLQFRTLVAELDSSNRIIGIKRLSEKYGAVWPH